MKPWMRPAQTMFAVAWGGNEFTPLLVMYKSQHHLSAVTVDVLLFAYVLGIVPALLIGGPLSDRFGRRALLRPAPFVAAGGSLVLAFAHAIVPLLFLGRVLSGIGLGLVMAVGSSWVKELSSPPFENNANAVGARRGAMSLTAGFGIGAAVAGCLSQWGPYPDELPYLINVLVTVPAFFLLARTPETVTLTENGRLIDDLRVPSAGHRRFLYVVLPVAPWVFGAAACAYAVLPALMASHVTGAPIAFSALLCVVGLGCGFLIQSFGGSIDRPGTARAVMCALTLLAVGMGVAAIAAAELRIWTAVLGAAVLGSGYGLAMMSGLLEIQRIATPTDLAGLTAVFYSVTYLGFGVPAVMAALGMAWGLPYTTMFIFGVVMALVCLAVVAVNAPRTERETQGVTA